jgi:hypothetical protein
MFKRIPSESIATTSPAKPEMRLSQLNIEFTQHIGDEMYHQRMGGFRADWTEVKTKLRPLFLPECNRINNSSTNDLLIN